MTWLEFAAMIHAIGALVGLAFSACVVIAIVILGIWEWRTKK